MCGKRWRLSLCKQFQNVKPVHLVFPFQNGRPVLVKALNTGGRLGVQTGPGGSILPCPIRSTLEEVCKVSVEGDSLQVHVHMFWAGSGAIGFYRVIKNSNLTT